MAGSALLGEPPATHDDVLIYKALLMLNGTSYFPVPSESLVTDRPPDDSNSAPLVAATVVLMTLVILLTAARVWAQQYRKKRHFTFWVSNVFLFFSAMATLAYDSIVLHLYTQGCSGRHINYCTYEDIEQMSELLIVPQCIFYFAVYCAKLSIISFLRGAVEHTVEWWNLANAIFFGLVVFIGLWSLLSTICTCVPVAAHFSLIVLATTDPNSYHCLPELRLQVANRTLHIATDLCLFMFPLFLVWRVQISWQRKILFIVPFTLGLLTVASSIGRNVEMPEALTDVSWNISRVSVWDFLDIHFSAMLMSMPFIMPLIDRTVRWYRERGPDLAWRCEHQLC